MDNPHDMVVCPPITLRKPLPDAGFTVKKLQKALTGVRAIGKNPLNY
jgi:hypothetical protein